MTKSQTLEKEKEGTSQSKNMVFIDCIQITPERKAIISYKSSNDEVAQTVTYSGKEEVTDEFFKSFQKNKETFVRIVKPLAADIKNLDMNKIHFTYAKDNDYLSNILYSAKYKFNDTNNQVINISTPKIPIYQSDFSDNVFCVSGECVEWLHETIALAKKYMKGDTRTKQMKLVVDNTNA